MSQPIIAIQEDDLHAYVDNQLSEEKRKAVEALIQTDLNVAKKIQQWQLQNRAIREHFKEKSFIDIPEQLDLDKLHAKDYQVTNRSPKHHWFYTMAASLLLMITGSFMGWFAHSILQPVKISPSAPNFINSAISAYEVFSVEALHPVELGADKKDHLVTWLSKRINHPIQMPKLDNYGFKLLGGRLLSMQQGRAAAQFMFENNQGQRIAWLISKSSIYKNHAFFFKNEKKINSFYWMDSEVAYSVSGEMNRESLHKLSQDIYQQINSQKNQQVASLLKNTQ